MVGVKLLVGPHDCHQIFRFTQIDNIVDIARQHMNGLNPAAADLKFDLFIGADLTFLNQPVSGHDHEEFPLFWQQGYASEAARAALAFAFNDLALDEVVSFTSLGNQRSQAVMARLGMQRAPEHFQHPALPPAHPLREHCLYRLAKNDRRANCTTSSSLKETT